MTILPHHASAVSNQPGSIIFIPHGGGPKPLLGDPGHRELVDFLRHIPASLITPTAILVISAHWEEDVPTLLSNPAPEMYYDYYGFPEEAYSIRYPAPGTPQLAGRIAELLRSKGIATNLDDRRGFDHGVFIPLNLMYPAAEIPCLQLSLLTSLNAEEHIRLGQALRQLRQENILVIGSGFSFHNLRAFFQPPTEASQAANDGFEDWLIETCFAETLDEKERLKRLTAWTTAPAARFCHPREEHLLPLLVCYGIASGPATQVYTMEIMNKRASSFIW